MSCFSCLFLCKVSPKTPLSAVWPSTSSSAAFTHLLLKQQQEDNLKPEIGQNEVPGWLVTPCLCCEAREQQQSLISGFIISLIEIYEEELCPSPHQNSFLHDLLVAVLAQICKGTNSSTTSGLSYTTFKRKVFFFNFLIFFFYSIT